MPKLWFCLSGISRDGVTMTILLPSRCEPEEEPERDQRAPVHGQVRERTRRGPIVRAGHWDARLLRPRQVPTPVSVSHLASSAIDLSPTPTLPDEFSAVTTPILPSSLRLWGVAITMVSGLDSLHLVRQLRHPLGRLGGEARLVPNEFPDHLVPVGSYAGIDQRQRREHGPEPIQTFLPMSASKQINPGTFAPFKR